MINRILLFPLLLFCDNLRHRLSFHHLSNNQVVSDVMTFYFDFAAVERLCCLGFFPSLRLHSFKILQTRTSPQGCAELSTVVVVFICALENNCHDTTRKQCFIFLIQCFVLANAAPALHSLYTVACSTIMLSLSCLLVELRKSGKL